jgi:hypothetical protein
MAKILILWVDVTELTDEQVGALSGELQAQTESSEGDWGEGTGHPGVNVVYENVLEAPQEILELAKRSMEPQQFVDRVPQHNHVSPPPMPACPACEQNQRAALRREWAIPMGPQVGLDTESSASRQHRIDTGEYLRKGEAWSS